MRTFTLNGWASSIVVESDDSTSLTLTDAEGEVTTLMVIGDADARVTLDAPSEHAPRPASLEIEASAPTPKE